MNIDYSYLRPPPHAQNIHHTKDYIKKFENKMHKRKIFYNCEFDSFQLAQIQKLRLFLKEKGIDSTKYNQPQLLRICYMGDFNLTKCLQKMKVCEEWNTNVKIQTLSQSAKQILETGIFYTYGRDYEYRPIIILNIARINTNRHKLDDIYCAMHHLFKPIQQFMFLPGKIQNWNVIIDSQQKINLPLTSISSIIDKLGTVYSCTIQKIFIVNMNVVLRAVYAGIKNFIHAQTQKKIDVLGAKEMNKLFKYLPHSEVEKKYGGKLQNLTTFWPIKTTIKHITPRNQQDGVLLEGSQYQSIDNNSQYFKIEQNGGGCCCGQQKCLIF